MKALATGFALLTFRLVTLPAAPLPAAVAAERMDWDSQMIRVQIFPHISHYTSPQGEESELGEISLNSNQNCRVEETGEQAKSLRFVREKIDKPLHVRCEGATELRREPALTSYSYLGDFQIETALAEDGSPFIRVLNLIRFADYLKGVVPAEVPPGWPDEVLRAQAIAARTYAIYEIQALRKLGAELDDTVQYQAYLGVSRQTVATSAAVDATRNQILTYQGEPIKAYFFADSGGHTEDAGNVFGTELPYAVGKAELFNSALIPRSQWQRRWRLSDVADMLAANGLIPSDERLDHFEVLDSERTEAGRAAWIHVYFSDKTQLMIRGKDFAAALRLPSFYIWLEPKGEDLVIRGRGRGHGVGMSQEGANYLAAHFGWTSSQILKFYYTGIEITQ